MSDKYAKCEKDHTLNLMTHNPFLKNGVLYGGVKCDKCATCYLASPERPVSHCDECSYDICNECLSDEDLHEQSSKLLDEMTYFKKLSNVTKLEINMQ